MNPRLAVAVVGSIDASASEILTTGLLLNGARTAALTYRHRFDQDSRMILRRQLIDDTGSLIYDDELSTDGDCACCLLREDLPDALSVVIADGRWERLIIAPPLATPLGAVAAQLNVLQDDQNIRLCQVLTAIDAAVLTEDLFGDDLLDERGAGLSHHDRRSVGEALAEQIEYADLVVGALEPSQFITQLLSHLTGERWRPDWTVIPDTQVFDAEHDVALAQQRADPLRAAPQHASDETPAGDVWTLDLHTPRPVHPGRLLARLSDLASGQIRGRGYVWLPSRPHTPCLWDASGGQLSIGTGPDWGNQTPSTRLVITGVDATERTRIERAFTDVVCRSDEATDPVFWSPRKDGFEPWLGKIVAG